jgi:hypothetical protein
VSVQDFATALQATSFSTGLQTIGWMVQLLQTLHILMIGVVFVSMLMVALRVLGWMRADEPLAGVWRRFAPFFWAGLAVLAVTGLLLTTAEPVRELMALSFRIKLLLLAIGIASAAAFGLGVRRAAAAVQPLAGARHEFPARVRLAAVATVLLWLAVLFLGRAIAYDHEVWGAWSPAVLQRGA